MGAGKRDDMHNRCTHIEAGSEGLNVSECERLDPGAVQVDILSIDAYLI